MVLYSSSRFQPSAQTSPLKWYYALLQSSNQFAYDPLQEQAIQLLDQLYHQLIYLKDRSFLRKLLRPSMPQGLYIHGSVGRGKSLLMDAFFGCLPYKKKRRVHFHAFMQEIQHNLKCFQGTIEPLAILAKQVAHTAQVVCIDELDIRDIADAMIIGKLFTAFLAQNIVLVITSNCAPEALYTNGMQRSHFLPTIALLREKLRIIELAGTLDYRLQGQDCYYAWFDTKAEGTEQRLHQLFSDLSVSVEQPTQIVIHGRTLHSKRHTLGLIWFTFNALCKTARAQTDYLFLAQHYHTVFLSDIPCLKKEDAEAACRLTWLVDVLYDAKIKLIISSEVRPAFLYVEGRNKEEFLRTRSRLEEMQSMEYLESIASSLKNRK